MHRIVIAALALVAAVATVATTATAGDALEPGVDSLSLHGVLEVRAEPGVCPPGEAATVTCSRHEGTGLVHGLGQVSASSLVRFAVDTVDCDDPDWCPYEVHDVLPTTVRFAIEGKSAIDFALSGYTCVVEHAACYGGRRPYSVTGGTGIYAGAAGSGMVETTWAGTEETWTGTLTAPGLDFTLPKLTGAVAKSVRAAKGAKSARVTFEVTATDDGGGDIPVSCHPSSGSRFPLGETFVLCWATDPSGNTATAGFTVTVKRGR